MIADLKSARKNTIETNKPFLNKGFPKKIFGMINYCYVAIFARFNIYDPDVNMQHAIEALSVFSYLNYLTKELLIHGNISASFYFIIKLLEAI